MWSSVSGLLGSREMHSMVLYRSTLVVLGGRNPSNWNGINTCEQYNHTSNLWSSFAAFTTARALFAAAVVLDKIYIAGGNNGPTVEVWNGTSWSFLPTSMVSAHQGGAAVSFQGMLVVLGGQNMTEVYNPITAIWATLPPMLACPFRADMAAVSF
jgi:hypothetical protein